jgi:alkaline phosphatase D
MWVWIGDIIYTDEQDYTSKDVEVYKGQALHDFNRTKELPSYASFTKKVDIIGVWDDHDYGINNGDKHFKEKEFFKNAYLDFIGEPDDSERRNRGREHGIFQDYLI